jgi:hypothetical protein
VRQALDNDVILGAGRIYGSIAAWGGKMSPPSPVAMRQRWEDGGKWLAFVGDAQDGTPRLVAWIQPQVDGLTVADAFRVWGHAGATSAVVWQGETVSQNGFDGARAAMDVSGAGSAVAKTIADTAETTREIANVSGWMIRNWPLVAVAVVLGYLWYTGRIRT